MNIKTSFKYKILIAFALILFFLLISPYKVEAAQNMSDFLHSVAPTYDQCVSNYSPSDLTSMKWSYAYGEDTTRFNCKRYMCLEIGTTSAADLFYCSCVIDINGENPMDATIYNRDGSTSSVSKNKYVAGLAYLSYLAEKNEYPHKTNSTYWYSFKVGYCINKIINECGCDAPYTKDKYTETPENSPDTKAYMDACVAGTNTEGVNARIICFKGGAMQNTAFLYGSTEPATPKALQIKKYITSCDYDRSGWDKAAKRMEPVEADVSGSEIEYTIEVTNTSEDSTVDYDLTDIFEVHETHGLQLIDEGDLSFSGNTGTGGGYLEPGETDTWTFVLETFNDEYEEFLSTSDGTVAFEFPDTIYENNVKIDAIIHHPEEGDSEVKDDDSDFVIVGIEIPEEPPPPEEADPDGVLKKYVTSVKHKDGTTTPYSGRSDMSNTDKYNDPVVVEKGDIITFQIDLTLNQYLNAYFNPTYDYMYDVVLQDTPEDGLKLVSGTDGGLTGFTVSYGQTYSTEIQYEVTKSNLYLFNLENNVKYVTAKFIHVTRYRCYHRYYSHWVYEYTEKNVESVHPGFPGKLNGSETPATGWPEDSSKRNSEFVRLEELVISGYVFDDEDKDGKMEKTLDGKKVEDARLEKISVILHDLSTSKDGKSFTRDTETDANGYYEFPLGDFQKGTLRQENGNYSRTASTKQSELRNYYIEFKYNGITYQSTPEYAGRSNLGTNNAITDDYKIDSNACEYDAERAAFNDAFTTIAYNKAYPKATEEEPIDEDNNYKGIAFTKNEHVSTLDWTNSVTMSSYSFVKDDKASRDNLFLSPTATSETEYLRYINLGLYQREKLDLSLTKDLYKAQIRINGYTLDYDFGNGISFDTEDDRVYFKDGYTLFVYRSDYEFRTAQYDNAPVRALKNVCNARDENAELEIDLTYKIRISNDSPSEFGPDPDGNNKTYAAVDEIVDYNSSTLTIYRAWLEDEDGNTSELKYTAAAPNTDAKESIYNDEDNYIYDGYETNFITGDALSKNVLMSDKDTNEVEYIYVTYRVDHENEGNRGTALDKGYVLIEEDPTSETFTPLVHTNVAQISAYSSYDDEERTNGYGLIDIDSNAGNINKAQKPEFEDSFDTKEHYETYFEDNSFRVDMEIHLKDDERKISGLVFEDTRSERLQIKSKVFQYIANGIFTDKNETVHDIRHGDLENNSSVYKLLRNIRGATTDETLEGMTVQLIEVAKGNDNRVYEETIDPTDKTNTLQNVYLRTGSDGTYTLKNFIPGIYIVRFKFGDTYKDNTITYNSFMHNGQDYKATQYVLKDKLEETETDNEKRLEMLKYGQPVLAEGATGAGTEEPEVIHVSDARENELRRIEVMANSEVMNNQVANKMRVDNFKAPNAPEAGKSEGTSASIVSDVSNYESTSSELKKLNYTAQNFSDETYSFADTISFSMGIENRRDTKDKLDIEVEDPDTFNSIFVQLENVDFGVEYRPESYVELNKRIKEIKLETASGETVVDIQYNEDGTLVPKDFVLNGVKVEQTGIDNLQSIDNYFEGVKGFNPSYITSAVQGFRYLNVDEDILQGAKLSVVYYVVVNNQGEVDTISENLKAAGGSRNVHDKLKDIDDGDVYGQYAPDSERIITSLENVQKITRAYKRTDDLMNEVINEGKAESEKIDYTYGHYTGGVYYYGANGLTLNNLVVVPLKVQKIIDFIDNDATFRQTINSDKNKSWTAIEETELMQDKLIDGALLKEISETVRVYLDDEQRRFTGDNRDNLIVSMFSSEINEQLVKDITPLVASSSPDAKVDHNWTYDDRKLLDYSGYIMVEMNQTLASENKSEDMVYDNTAEIVEFSIPTGRITNFASTVGNIQVNGDRTSFKTSLEEIDAATTEVVRLTPPTGQDFKTLFVSNNKGAINAIVGITGIAILSIVGVAAVSGTVGKRKSYK